MVAEKMDNDDEEHDNDTDDTDDDTSNDTNEDTSDDTKNYANGDNLLILKGLCLR